MARKRMIDPEFWSDEEIGKWSRSARLFYIGLWNFSDDSGRFKASLGLLKGQIFPYDDPRSLKIQSIKEEVSSKVVWYEVNGLQYGYLRNFNKHQRIDRPQPSKLPSPPENKIGDNSANNQGLVVPNIREVNIREVNIREVNISKASPALKAALDKIYKEINIYAFMNKLKKQLKWPAEQQFPEEVLLKVCATYDKGQVKDEWAWFTVAIKKASAEYFAEQNIKTNNEFKKAPIAQSIKDILCSLIQ